MKDEFALHNYLMVFSNLEPIKLLYIIYKHKILSSEEIKPYGYSYQQQKVLLNMFIELNIIKVDSLRYFRIYYITKEGEDIVEQLIKLGNMLDESKLKDIIID